MLLEREISDQVKKATITIDYILDSRQRNGQLRIVTAWLEAVVQPLETNFLSQIVSGSSLLQH